MSALHSGRMSAFVRQCAKYPLSKPIKVACGWDCRSRRRTEGPTYPVLPVINIFISTMHYGDFSAQRAFAWARARHPRLGIDGHFGNRDDKLAPPCSNAGHLRHDLVFEIPRQNKQVVRLGFLDLVGMQ